MSRFFDSLKPKPNLKFRSDNESPGDSTSTAIGLASNNIFGLSTATGWNAFSPKKIFWPLIIFMFPITGALLLAVVDPTARPLIEADYAKYNSQKIVHYSEALKMRKDPETLVRRARVYNEEPDSAKLEEKDLKAAADLGDKSTANLYERAMLRANSQGIDAETISLLNDCVSRVAEHKNTPFDLNNNTGYLSNVAYALLCCGEFKRVSQICDLPKSHAYGLSEVGLLQAVMDRENGKTKSAMDRLKKSESGIHTELYTKLSLFKALIDLDRKDYAAAEEDGDLSTTDTTEADFKPYWTSEYIAAWSAYEQGKASEVVTKANAVIANFTDDQTPDIGELNALSAAYLLKAHALLKQGSKGEATKAFRSFQKLKAQGITGKIVTPMPYRIWTDKVALSQ